MATKAEDKSAKIPKLLFDFTTLTTYIRCRFFGKGSFAKCYTIVDMETENVYAGKMLSKKLMMKRNQEDNMTQEIKIHRSLSHPNIVKFHGLFEDTVNVYIVLELCKSRSMMELHKRRKSITEYECRYYIYQIIQGVKYLHDNGIIHRNLKLGNLFLDDQLHVKIGDFGLATRIEYAGERKKTLCGTPNYIAPEILTEKGHSFEVDIWSIGCVMYTLLVGQPPFEAKTLKDTYTKTKKSENRAPIYLSKSAPEMVIAMLQSNPDVRPAIGVLLDFDFLRSSPVPCFLPRSCLSMAPRLHGSEALGVEVQRRRPLCDVNVITDGTRPDLTFLLDHLYHKITASAQVYRHNEDFRADIESLHKQLADVIHEKPQILTGNLGDENTDPAAEPLYWIKWACYSKTAFFYQLCDKSIGVRFNDTTKMILLSNQINVHYIDKDGKESYMTTTEYCQTLDEKIELISGFMRYVTKPVVKVGANNVNIECDQISRMPHLYFWFCAPNVVLMHLTNGSVQLNFNNDMKIILCPRMSAITYMDQDNHFRTYRFATIVQHGCSRDLHLKLSYAYEILGKMLQAM